MRIAVPKEIKNHEYRVGLTPASVRELVAHGHEAGRLLRQTASGCRVAAGDHWRWPPRRAQRGFR